MVTEIMSTIGEVIGEYTKAITSLFDNLIAIFYNSSDNKLTLFGTLFLIAVGIGIVAWGFNLIRSLINL